MADRRAPMIYLALLLLTSLLKAQGARTMEGYLAGGGEQKQSRSPSAEAKYVPVPDVVYRRSADMGREPFQTCGACRCCEASNSSNCINSQCCFHINCNLPGKAFGTCAFSPRTCGCGPNKCARPPASSKSSAAHLLSYVYYRFRLLKDDIDFAFQYAPESTLNDLVGDTHTYCRLPSAVNPKKVSLFHCPACTSLPLTKPKSLAMASSPAPTICLTLLSLALFFNSLQAQGASKEEQLAGGEHKQGSWRRSPTEERYMPMQSMVYRSAVALPAASTAEAYQPFELCDGCRCCAESNSSMCVDTSCCYAIDCDIPGKPYGVCAFTPRSCGCGANNCSQPT
ncbi:hypothetical protein EJB05_02031 [Eragrostis curvula]|uniref:DUF7866 domain-containing protein n=1 Tax=Eragrostis curvula TaxID=38414 RepID=A0A5J9WPG6_9POAL|nr:hypothetical protein EJB05_02031 [Eragrostis curvula]